MFIRPAEEKDIPDLTVIIRNDLGYSDAKEDFIHQQFLNMDRNRETILVAESDEVTGFIHIEKYSCIYFGPVGNILALAVKKEFRKQGIGKQLLKAAEEWSKQKNCIGMRLNSGGSRLDAHGFYRSQGYDNEKPQVRFLKMYGEK